MAVEAATQNSLFQNRGTAGICPRSTRNLGQKFVGYQMAVEASTQNSLFQNSRNCRNLSVRHAKPRTAACRISDGSRSGHAKQSLSKSRNCRNLSAKHAKPCTEVCRISDSGRSGLFQSLQQRGFKQVPHVPCLFHNDKTVLIVYVDDVLIYGKDRNDIQALVDSLNKDFALSDAGEDVHSYLGIKQAQPAQRHCRHIAAISHRATFEITQLFAERREPHATPRHAADVKVSSHADEDGDDHSPDPTGWTYSMMSLTLDAQQLWNRTPSTVHRKRFPNFFTFNDTELHQNFHFQGYTREKTTTNPFLRARALCGHCLYF